MIRAVFDANVIASALIRPEGAPGLVVARVIAGTEILPVVSPAILDEYRRCLAYPKVRRRIALPADEIGAWVDAFSILCDVVPGTRSVRVVAADADDDKYVAAAVEAKAAFIVSGDRDLLDVGHHEGVGIVTARTFLDLLEKRTGK